MRRLVRVTQRPGPKVKASQESDFGREKALSSASCCPGTGLAQGVAIGPLVTPWGWALEEGHRGRQRARSCAEGELSRGLELLCLWPMGVPHYVVIGKHSLDTSFPRVRNAAGSPARAQLYPLAAACAWARELMFLLSSSDTRGKQSCLPFRAAVNTERDSGPTAPSAAPVSQY